MVIIHASSTAFFCFWETKRTLRWKGAKGFWKHTRSMKRGSESAERAPLTLAWSSQRTLLMGFTAIECTLKRSGREDWNNRGEGKHCEWECEFEWVEKYLMLPLLLLNTKPITKTLQKNEIIDAAAPERTKREREIWRDGEKASNVTVRIPRTYFLFFLFRRKLVKSPTKL